VAPGVINFAVGIPGANTIPKKAIDDAFADAIAANKDPLMYQYSKMEGTRAFRASMASFLRANGLPGLEPEHICASFGNSLALATVAKIFARPGACAVVEDPTYFLAGKMFHDAGLRVVRVGMDHGGLQVSRVRS
jgi:2-aminoadipate transaminase